MADRWEWVDDAFVVLVVVLVVAFLCRLAFRKRWLRLGLPIVAITGAAVALALNAPGTETSFAGRVSNGAEHVVRKINARVADRETKDESQVEVDAFDWAIVGVGLLMLLRWWASVSVRGDPAYVAVDSVKDATGLVETEAVVAQLRDRLAASDRLAAPTAPSAGQADPVLNVAQELPKGQAVVTLLRSLIALLTPSRAFLVAATVRKESDAPDARTGVTIEVKDAGTSRVRMVKTEWAANHMAAADRAADAVVVWLTSEEERDATPWNRRWTSVDALAAYLKATEVEREARAADVPKELRSEKLREATSLLCHAVEAERANMEVRVRLANLLEQQDRWVDALEVYVEAAARWRWAFPIVYRMGVVLNCAEKWVPQYVGDDTPPDKRVHLRDLLAHHWDERFLGLCHDDGRPLHPDVTREHVREVMPAVWARIERELTWERTVRRWVGRSVVKWRHRDRREFTALLAPWNQLRGARVKMVRMAAVVAEIERKPVHESASVDRICRMIRRRRRRPFVNWQVRYNAACAYSRLAAKTVDPEQRARLFELAAYWLDRAWWDPSAGLKLPWVINDPDLDALRDTPWFKAWADALSPPPPPTPPPSPELPAPEPPLYVRALRALGRWLRSLVDPA